MSDCEAVLAILTIPFAVGIGVLFSWGFQYLLIFLLEWIGWP